MGTDNILQPDGEDGQFGTVDADPARDIERKGAKAQRRKVMDVLLGALLSRCRADNAGYHKLFTMRRMPLLTMRSPKLITKPSFRPVNRK